MGILTQRRRLPPNLLIPSHAAASPTASPASSQGRSSPHAHTGPGAWALPANTQKSRSTQGWGFAWRSAELESPEGWRGHYELSAPSLCPKTGCRLPRPFPKDTSNLD